MLPAGGPRIELLEASPSPIQSSRKFIEKRGEGLHHVAVKVPDLAATVERLQVAAARACSTSRAPAPADISTSSFTRPPPAACCSNSYRNEETNHRHYRRQRAIFHARL